MKNTLRYAAAALLMVTLSACGGSSKVTVQESGIITKGQELTDLQRALAEQAISQDEYETLRKKIMKRKQ